MEEKVNITYTLEKFIDDFNSHMYGIHLDFIHLWCASKFDSSLESLSEWHEKAIGLKIDAQQKKAEKAANIFFSVQCYCASLINLFRMWQLIKSSDSNEAWNKLIDSQEYAKISIQAHKTSENISLSLFLNDIEKTVFPKPAFVSSGFTYRAGKCSICHKRFDKCKHKEGFVYIGKLCRQVQLRDVEFEHLALVENPKDKRCRIVSMEINGMFQDLLSGEVRKCDNPSVIDGKRFEALFFYFKPLPNI